MALLRVIIGRKASPNVGEALTKIAGLEIEDDKEWLVAVAALTKQNRSWIAAFSIRQCLDHLRNNNIDTNRKLQEYLGLASAQPRSVDQEVAYIEKRYNATDTNSEREALATKLVKAVPMLKMACDSEGETARPSGTTTTESPELTWEVWLEKGRDFFSSATKDPYPRLIELGQLRMCAGLENVVGCLADELLSALADLPPEEQLTQVEALKQRLMVIHPLPKTPSTSKAPRNSEMISLTQQSPAETPAPPAAPLAGAPPLPSFSTAESPVPMNSPPDKVSSTNNAQARKSIKRTRRPAPPAALAPDNVTPAEPQSSVSATGVQQPVAPRPSGVLAAMPAEKMPPDVPPTTLPTPTVAPPSPADVPPPTTLTAREPAPVAVPVDDSSAETPSGALTASSAGVPVPAPLAQAGGTDKGSITGLGLPYAMSTLMTEANSATTPSQSAAESPGQASPSGAGTPPNPTPSAEEASVAPPGRPSVPAPTSPAQPTAPPEQPAPQVEVAVQAPSPLAEPGATNKGTITGQSSVEVPSALPTLTADAPPTGKWPLKFSPAVPPILSSLPSKQQKTKAATNSKAKQAKFSFTG